MEKLLSLLVIVLMAYILWGIAITNDQKDEAWFLSWGPRWWSDVRAALENPLRMMVSYCLIGLVLIMTHKKRR